MNLDYLKYDNCYNAGQSGTALITYNRYDAMSQALNETGICLSILPNALAKKFSRPADSIFHVQLGPRLPLELGPDDGQ